MYLNNEVVPHFLAPIIIKSGKEDWQLRKINNKNRTKTEGWLRKKLPHSRLPLSYKISMPYNHSYVLCMRYTTPILRKSTIGLTQTFKLRPKLSRIVNLRNILSKRGLSYRSKTSTTGQMAAFLPAYQTLPLGLVDELGPELAAIEKIKEKAGIETEIQWVKPPKITNISKLLGLETSLGSSFIRGAVDVMAERTTKALS